MPSNSVLVCRGIEAEHPELCSNIMFICGMSARGRTEFYQPIVEHFCSIPDDTDPKQKAAHVRTAGLCPVIMCFNSPHASKL